MKKKQAFIFLAMCCLTACGPKRRTDRIKSIIEKEKSSYPVRLSETITADSATYNENSNTLNYYYSVTGELDNPTWMDKNYASYKKALQEAIDNSVEMEEFRQCGTEIRYIYLSGSDGKQLAEFTFKSPN